MYRKATINDCEKVYDLICELECKKLLYDRFSAIYEKQINNERYYCLLCEQDGHIAGLLNLRFEEQLHHSECIAEVMEFIVASSYRKCGIGKEMLARLQKHFIVHKLSWLRISSGQMPTGFIPGKGCIIFILNFQNPCVKRIPLSIKYPAASNGVFDPRGSRQMSASSHLARCSRE